VTPHLINTRKPYFLSASKYSATTLALLVALLTMSACSVHKIDVQQGNVITQEMFEKLKIGMDKERVKSLLGTPLIVDPFRRDRWDYVYIYRAGNSDARQSAHLTVYFENEQLNKIDVQSTLPKEADVKKPGSKLRGKSSDQGKSAGHSH